MDLLTVLRVFSRGSWGPRGWKWGGGRQFLFYLFLGMGALYTIYMNFLFLAGKGGHFITKYVENFKKFIYF